MGAADLQVELALFTEVSEDACPYATAASKTATTTGGKMNEIPDVGLLALVITGYVIALPIAWLTGLLFKGLRSRVTAGVAFMSLVVLAIDAALLLGISWGTIYLADKHQFFSEWHWGQAFMVIGWVMWTGALFGAFSNGEKGKRINEDDAVL